MKILLLDNYDSFTYNLFHIFKEFGVQIDVVRNNKIVLNSLDKYDKIVLSPGPGIPSESGLLLEVIKYASPKKSILGVCLGLQAIGEVFGAKLLNLEKVYHGVQTPIKIIAEDYIFKNLPLQIDVGRYHSWAVDKNTIPECLEITAIDQQGEIMALRHRTLDIHAVQFHPESILTPQGKIMIKNFLDHV